MMASNFGALWPTDPKFLTFKDLNPFKNVSKVKEAQEASSILTVGFAETTKRLKIITEIIAVI